MQTNNSKEKVRQLQNKLFRFKLKNRFKDNKNPRDMICGDFYITGKQTAAE